MELDNITINKSNPLQKIIKLSFYSGDNMTVTIDISEDDAWQIARFCNDELLKTQKHDSKR